MDGTAIVYCQGAFNTSKGKIAHGLVRFTRRYNIMSVIDSTYDGKDSGTILDGKPNGIPIYATMEKAIAQAGEKKERVTHLVIGLNTDMGRLSKIVREDIRKALDLGLNIDSGLLDLMSDDQVLMNLAVERDKKLRDICRSPKRKDLHHFTGRITEVKCPKIAILGTDSTVGKLTTAWILLQGLEKAGVKAELIGTSPMAWLQGAKYALIFDAIINNFVSGEIENTLLEAYHEDKPDLIIIEGYKSILHPVNPGGFKVLAAGRPDHIILQHAPGRKEYDGFPGFPIQPLKKQIQAIELISGRKVKAITLNHECIADCDVASVIENVSKECGFPVFDVLHDGADEFVKFIKSIL
jgi:uncharacterized NAD-dependent epimerase/dehydratase family protein